LLTLQSEFDGTDTRLMTRRSSRAVPGFDGLDGVFKRLSQNAPADDPDHEAVQPSLDIFEPHPTWCFLQSQFLGADGVLKRVSGATHS
jgi:hypothetical protein